MLTSYRRLTDKICLKKLGITCINYIKSYTVVIVTTKFCVTKGYYETLHQVWPDMS